MGHNNKIKSEMFVLRWNKRNLLSRGTYISIISEPTCTIGGQLIFMSVEARELFDVSGISGILAVKAVDSPYARNIDSIANCRSLTYVCGSLLGFAVLFPPRTSTYKAENAWTHSGAGAEIVLLR